MQSSPWVQIPPSPLQPPGLVPGGGGSGPGTLHPRAHRPLRPQPDGAAPRRQPADRAAGLAVRPLGGRPVPAADRGPRPGRVPRRAPPVAAGRPPGAGAGLGRRGDPPVRPVPAYEDALARLDAPGLLYPCYCTRREVQAAASAPHGPLPEGAYPGTCRDLTTAERHEREAAGRRPCVAARAGGHEVEVDRPARRGGSARWSTTSWSAGPTACPPTRSPSWWTTPPRASARSCRGADLLDTDATPGVARRPPRTSRAGLRPRAAGRRPGR